MTKYQLTYLVYTQLNNKKGFSSGAYMLPVRIDAISPDEAAQKRMEMLDDPSIYSGVLVSLMHMDVFYVFDFVTSAKWQYTTSVVAH